MICVAASQIMTKLGIYKHRILIGDLKLRILSILIQKSNHCQNQLLILAF
jgi:hypothetical protein